MFSRRDRQGFSLVEILFGIIIFVGIMLVFSLTVRSATQESSFSEDHFSALMLTQKVGEDLIEEYAINPYANESLVLDHGQARKNSIVDGGSVFFMAVDDRKQPWGRIDSFSDGGIDNSLQPLYDQVQNFHVMTSASHGSFGGFMDESNDMQHLQIAMSWQTGARSSNLARDFFVFAPKSIKKSRDEFPSVNYSDPSFERSFRIFFPGNQYRSVAEIVAYYQLDGRIAFEYAAIIDIFDRFFNSTGKADLLRDTQLLERQLANLNNPYLELKLKSKIAKNNFKLAKACFLTLAEMITRLKIVVDSPDAYLTIDKMSPWGVKNCHDKILWMNKYLQSCLEQSRRYYLDILGTKYAKFISVKVEQTYILRLFDLYRISLYSDRGNLYAIEYRDYLDKIKESMRWRNMFLFRYASQEEEMMRDPRYLAQKFPNLAVIEETLRNRFNVVRRFIFQHR